MEPVVVVFAGEYTVGSKGKLHRELSRLATKPRLVLDFSEVTYMDSTCIAELMRMEYRRSNAKFEATHIVMQSPVLLRIFSVLTLDRVFRVVPTLSQAIDSGVEGLHVQYAFCGDDGAAKVPVDYERVSATA